jgi:hypothetical protein
MSDFEAGWVTNKEKLLCLMVLNDNFASAHNFTQSGIAYFRAFIVQDRVTGVITGRFRFIKKSGKRDWYTCTPKEQNDLTVTKLIANTEDALVTAAKLMGISAEEVSAAIECHYPPDDGGDDARTVLWLDERDLIEMKGFEPIDPKENDQK